MTTLPPVAQIASGTMVTIARTLDGRVFTWGEGYALGRGPWASALLPQPLDLGDALDGLGDTLRIRQEPSGTVLTWGSRWGTSLHRVYRSTVPARTDEAMVAEVPGLTWTDVEPAAPIFFYRVAGVDCAGVEGP